MPVFPRLANLDPVRLLDELMTALGSWLLDFIPRLGAFLRSLTKLPAGLQLLLVIGALLILGLSFSLMRKAFRDARTIRRGARDAQVRSQSARAELAVSDRRKAFGYLMFILVAIVAALLVFFVYQSLVGAGAGAGTGVSE